MKSKLTKYGLMTIAAVLLVTMAFAGAASADGYVKVWNGTGLQSMIDGQSISDTLGGYANLTGTPGTTDSCVLELNNFNVGSVASPVSSTIIDAYVPNLTIKLVGESNLICNDPSQNGLILCQGGNLTITSTDSGNGKLLVNNTLSGNYVRSIYTSMGSLTINDGVNITAIAFGTNDVYPIYSNDGISISGENTVVNINATASTGEAFGLFAQNSISINDGANVTGATHGNTYTHGLKSNDGCVLISGQNTVVDMKAISDNAYAYAILGGDQIKIDSAKKVTAIGIGDANTTSFAYSKTGARDFSGLATGYTFSNATNPGSEPTTYAAFNNSNWYSNQWSWKSNYTAVTIERILGPTPIDYEVTIINATGTHHLTNQSDTVIGDNGYAKATKVGDVVVLTLNNFKQNLATNDPIIVSATPNLKIVLNGESNLTGCYSNNNGGLLYAAGNLTITTTNGGKLLVNNTNTSASSSVSSIYVLKNLTIEDGANVTAIANMNVTAMYIDAYAIYADGNISITGADTVVDAKSFSNNATSSNDAKGIFAKGDILISSGVTVNVNTIHISDATGAGEAIAISSPDSSDYGDILIESGAKVTVTASSKMGNAYTIRSGKRLAINDSTVTAKAKGYQEFTNGLDAADTIVVSGENTVIDATAISNNKSLAYAFFGANITITSAKKITAISSSVCGNASSFGYNDKDTKPGYRDFSGLATGYTFSNATISGAAPTSYAVFNDSNNWHIGYDGEDWDDMISNYTAVTIEKGSTPAPYTPSSSSKHSGSTVILSEGQVAPTAYATAAPTVAPTVKPTEKPATPTVIATEKPTTTPKTPAPFVGLLAGLGAAAVLLRLRK